MCGITGWVDWERDLRPAADVLGAMTATLACRGPDAEGTWVTKGAALGHRRLAVIDLVGGAQPMQVTRPATEHAVALTYCGELFNFRELRRELEGHGHRFQSRSDTEVLLRAYLQWGARCLDRFNGMYAFAIWDQANEELLLARDRLGVKPLYYFTYDGGVLFGSEPKALLANPLVEPVVDDDGLAEIFAMFGGRTPGHGTFRGVREVRPGCLVEVHRRGIRHRRYWQLESRPHSDDLGTTVATVRELLADTVERQLVSDVPLGALVSGGIDSSAIAALATRSLHARGASDLATYAVDFAGSEADFQPNEMHASRDVPYVKLLVDHIGSRHSTVVLDNADLLAASKVATSARDLPSLGDLDASLCLLFKAVRQHVSVALSGESADEVFGGYPWFSDPVALARPWFPWAASPVGLAAALAPGIQERIRPEQYVRDRYADALAEVPRLEGETGDDRRLREVFYLGLTRFLPVLLDRKDRMSMAYGLEVRVPFCDHRLVEYLWNVPWETKTVDGVPKGLLRRAVADLLPPALVERPKSAFPAVVSPTYDAMLAAEVQRMLGDDSPVTGLLDAERVRAVADGTAPHPAWRRRMALAYLLQAEHWMRTYDVRVLTTV